MPWKEGGETKPRDETPALTPVQCPHDGCVLMVVPGSRHSAPCLVIDVGHDDGLWSPPEDPPKAKRKRKAKAKRKRKAKAKRKGKRKKT